jgi:hypothetical protein
MKVYKLGSIVKDIATKQSGMLTQMHVQSDHSLLYAFQPNAINPKDGLPVSSYWIAPNRVKSNLPQIDIDLPLEVLGTEVIDKATGFKGMAVILQVHTSGCVHVDIQPSGYLKDTKEKIATYNLDIRRLKGKAIKELTEEQLEISHKTNPSPCYTKPFNPGGSN